MAKRGINKKIMVGTANVVESDAADNLRGVVFEDDCNTGYFYARDYEVDILFVDALHIYTVENVADKELESVVDILWSDNFMQAVLLINNYPHAVFDFSKKKSYSRDNFPDPDPTTGWSHHEWDDGVREWFF